MKKSIIISFTILLVTLFSTQEAFSQKKAVTKGAKIEAYYFHFSHRCNTCVTVEKEAKKDIMALYPQLFKSGKITFKSLDIADKKSKPLVDKHNVDGQSLLITCGNQRIDLTDKAFMYAVNNPEKLKAEIKKTIDNLIK